MEVAAQPSGAATEGLLPAGRGDKRGALRQCFYGCNRRLIKWHGAVGAICGGREAFERADDQRLPARTCSELLRRRGRVTGQRPPRLWP